MLAFRHFANSAVTTGVERGELGVAEDGGLDLARRHFELAVAGPPRRLEERGAHGGEDLPVAVEVVDVAVRDAAAQVGVDVLQVLRLGAVDVAREVEVEVVLRVADLGQRHHAGVARDFELAGEGVDDLWMSWARRRFLLPSLMKPLRGIDHEDALAGVRRSPCRAR